jgi:hypothetical protein
MLRHYVQLIVEIAGNLGYLGSPPAILYIHLMIEQGTGADRQMNNSAAEQRVSEYHFYYISPQAAGNLTHRD